MKHLKIFTTYILIFFYSWVAKADCAGNWITFNPSTEKISNQPIFILEGSFFSEEDFMSVLHQDLYLYNDKGHRVALNLDKINRGKFMSDQAIYCLATELQTNEKYKIHWFIPRFVSKITRASWIVENIVQEPGRYSGIAFEFDRLEYISFGCGPEINAIFKVCNIYETNLWYKTELIDLTTSESSNYMLQAYKHKISVGHGMCGGPFTFENNHKYKVRFTPVTGNGVELVQSEWFYFDSPEPDLRI